MNPKCPSCKSKHISFTTSTITDERLFSCIECGNEWNFSVKVDPTKISRWRSFWSRHLQ